MKLEQKIAIALLETGELTISKPTVKSFREWLVKCGGRCASNGDVTTAKGAKVCFLATDSSKKLRVSLTIGGEP
jgi:hypothetical protein